MNTWIKDTNSVIFSLSNLETYSEIIPWQYINQFACNHSWTGWSHWSFILSDDSWNNLYTWIFNTVYDVNMKMWSWNISVTNFWTDVNCFVSTITYKDTYEVVWEYGMAITTFMMIIFFWLIAYYMAFKLVIFIDKPAIVDKIKDKYDQVKNKILPNK